MPSEWVGQSESQFLRQFPVAWCVDVCLGQPLQQLIHFIPTFISSSHSNMLWEIWISNAVLDRYCDDVSLFLFAIVIFALFPMRCWEIWTIIWCLIDTCGDFLSSLIHSRPCDCKSKVIACFINHESISYELLILWFLSWGSHDQRCKWI